MFRTFVLAAALALAPLLTAGPAAAGPALSTQAPIDPVAGAYDIKGDTFAGGEPYEGQVVVEKTGAVYRVIWFPGPDQIEGVGVLWGGQFTVAYTYHDGSPGLAAYAPVGGGWQGVWAVKSETRLAPESWTPR